MRNVLIWPEAMLNFIYCYSIPSNDQKLTVQIKAGHIACGPNRTEPIDGQAIPVLGLDLHALGSHVW